MPLHRLKVPEDAIHSDRERIDQVEALGVFGKSRSEIVWNDVSKIPDALTFKLPEADFWPGILPVCPVIQHSRMCRRVR